MKIAVIGGGAAGLMAAWAAAEAGASVTLFEKNEKCGKKIYITGKGRCNVTNDCDEREYLSHVVNGSKFLTSAVYAFSPRALMEHLESGGLRLKTERGNRVFPVSDKASDVTKCLENYCRSVGVNIKFNTKVLNLDILNSTMCGIITTNGAVSFDKVIVCTGGKSYPSTGSDGDGYVFAERAGHTVIKP
ncbi:MAG: aminoacetone oxidase family FAD-binding enzyme, partial [Oscillospiraceae bacterium]